MICCIWFVSWYQSCTELNAAENGVRTSVHELMQSHFGKLPDSYFVFVMNTAITETCAGFFNSDYLAIKSKMPETNIYFVLDEDGGISESTVYRFMTEIFKLEYNKELCTIDNKLFNDLSDAQNHNPYKLSSIIYIANRDLKHAVISKLHSMANLVFSSDLFEIELEKQTKVSTEKYLFSLGGDFVVFGDRLIQKSSIDKTIRILNPQTGEVERILERKNLNFSAGSLFSQVLAKTPVEVEIAKLGDSLLAANNRPDLRFVSIYVDESAKSIYVLCMMDIYGILQEDRTSINGQGITYKIPAGDTTFSTYFALIELDTNLSLQHVYCLNRSENVPMEIKEAIAFWPAFKFIVSDGYFYGHNEPEFSFINSPTDEEKRHLQYWRTTSRFKVNTNQLLFDSLLPVPMAKLISNRVDYYFKRNGIVYNSQEVSPEIFNLHNGEIVGKLMGSGHEDIPEYFNSDFTDTTKHMFNFRVCNQGPILSGSYHGFLYKYQNSTALLEIKDRDFNTVQVVDLQKLAGRENATEKELNAVRLMHNTAIGNDCFYWFVYENNEYFIYKYRFVLNG